MNTKYLVLSTLLLGLLLQTSCKNESDASSTKKVLTSGILKENMDTLVNPGDNFMAYVNGNWIKNTEIPSDKSAYGIPYMIHEESQENVKKIIEESASGKFSEGSDQQKVGDLYKSYMDMETRNKLGLIPIQAEFDKVDAIKNYDDLATYFAYANKYGISVPWTLDVDQDFLDPTIHSVQTYQSGLGLPDRDYYLKDDERSLEIRKEYVNHITKMFALAALSDAKNAAETVMAVETRLAEQHMEKEKAREWDKLFKRYPIDTLAIITPNFNWTAYLQEAGVENQSEIAILMLDYTMALDKIIQSTDLQSWKTYLKWGIIDANASRLNEAMDKQNFEFYSKELRGIPEQSPQWRRGVSVVNGTLGEVVGKVYVEKHFPPEAKERMQTLVENLLKAYEISITELDWMSAATKTEALKKLSKFTTKIGYPDKWKTYEFKINAEDLYGNLKRSKLFQYNKDLAKLNQPVDKSEWALTPQTVNAYYNPTLNEIVFPAAILQSPIFNMEADDAINYGAIGHIIGHEIGHGFDDSGSDFDGDGALRNWWTDEDKEEFEKRTAQLVTQYNAYEVLPDLFVNGEFTLGENIGDLGGLNIALKAYKLSLDGTTGPEIDGFTAEQRLFIGYAQPYCGKVRDEAMRVRINSDPHSPGIFRVNGVVRNIPEFYNAFQVKESDSLYLTPEERVEIW